MLTEGSRQTGVLPELMGSRLRNLKRIFQRISTSSGIGWHRAATFRHRYVEWKYQKPMERCARWEYQRSRTASRRWLQRISCDRSSNRVSTRTRTDTAQESRRKMPLPWLGSDAGATNGFWISTSKAFSVRLGPLEVDSESLLRCKE